MIPWQSVLSYLLHTWVIPSLRKLTVTSALLWNSFIPRLIANPIFSTSLPLTTLGSSLWNSVVFHFLNTQAQRSLLLGVPQLGAVLLTGHVAMSGDSFGGQTWRWELWHLVGRPGMPPLRNPTFSVSRLGLDDVRIYILVVPEEEILGILEYSQWWKGSLLHKATHSVVGELC